MNDIDLQRHNINNIYHSYSVNHNERHRDARSNEPSHPSFRDNNYD